MTGVCQAERSSKHRLTLQQPPFPGLPSLHDSRLPVIILLFSLCHLPSHPFPSACRAPSRELQCRQEEDAVLACQPSDSNKQCQDVIKAYSLCAEGQLFKMMNPAMSQFK